MSALREGNRISNYILEARRGEGSFGEVWRARHHILREVVAIKVPTDPHYVRNLQREGITAHGLKHPNIVRVIDLDPYGEPPYLVMEYVEGPSLREAIDAAGADFPIPAAVAILRGVLQALSVSHKQGVIHRDIKPGNILIAHPVAELASVTERAVKVTDFGLGHVGGITARSMMQSGSADLNSEEGRIAGTLAYMAPEQREGGEVDARSDLYSCGVVLFEMLTGERPAGHEMPSSVRASVPTYLDQVYQCCYARKERRFASAEAMLTAMVPRAFDGHVPPAIPAYAGRGAAAPASAGGVCSSCGAVTQRDDNFCIQCGRQRVAAVPTCRHCGTYVHANDRFCIRCGKSLTVLT